MLFVRSEIFPDVFNKYFLREERANKQVLPAYFAEQTILRCLCEFYFASILILIAFLRPFATYCLFVNSNVHFKSMLTRREWIVIIVKWYEGNFEAGFRKVSGCILQRKRCEFYFASFFIFTAFLRMFIWNLCLWNEN